MTRAVKYGSRAAKFSKCKNERVGSKFDGVKLNSKMSDDEIADLYEWAVDKWGNQDVLNELLTYDGLSQAASVLCRWPRPSELARVVAHERDTPLEYVRFITKFTVNDGASINTVIGRGGSKLIDLTKKNDLIYAWIKTDDADQDVFCLYLYAINTIGLVGNRSDLYRKCREASMEFIRRNSQYVTQVGKDIQKTFNMTSRSANFVGQS